MQQDKSMPQNLYNYRSQSLDIFQTFQQEVHRRNQNRPQATFSNLGADI